MADICLIPQVANAARFKFDMQGFPRVEQIYKHCLTQDYFIKALPQNQPDAE
jgi:glutathione S-transferase